VSEIAAIILAAGRATRFGAGLMGTKLVAEFAGKPLVRIVAESALASRARPVAAVIGHAAEKVTAALAGLDMQLTYAPDFRAGMSRSLQAGVAAVPEGAAGALVLLGDMPTISARLIDQLIDAFITANEPLAVVPTYAGRRGNPVLIGRKLFAAVKGLDGDRGASQLLAAAPGRIIECPLEDGAIFVDIDTQEDLRRLDLGRSCADARAPAP
jgi:molybdenum cofactor cytidylyltransferase